MGKEVSLLKTVKETIDLLSKRRKISLIAFAILLLFTSFAEIISISAVIPFIDLMINEERIGFYFSKFNLNYQNFSYDNNKIFLFVTFIFILSIIVASALKILLGYVGTKISAGIKHEITKVMYKNLINTEYLNEETANENDLLANLSKIDSLSGFIDYALGFFQAIAIFLIIFIFILFLSSTNIILGGIFFIIAYLSVLFLTKKILIKNSKLISKGIDFRTSKLNSTVGFLPIIILNNLKEHFYKSFTKIDYDVMRAYVTNTLFAKLPGVVMVTLLTIILSLVILFMKIESSNFVGEMAKLTALIYATQRMIPYLQQIYVNVTKLRSAHHQVNDFIIFIKRIKIKIKKLKKNDVVLKFKDKILFKNVNFSYKKNKEPTIKNLNFSFNKNDKILIQGPSGSGKSTLLKIILGLILPDSVILKIDNKKIDIKKYKYFRNNISFVPQDVFIANLSIKENIALGITEDDIDLERVEACAKLAEIHSLAARSKDKYNTILSHSARNISGGQKQRIGIARALYQNKDIIILDEATNALDNITEKKIFNNLARHKKDKTFVVISHKKAFNNFFNKKFSLKNKKLNYQNF